jgi:hypothetical protein
MKVIRTFIVRHHCSGDRNQTAVLFETDKALWYCQYWDEDKSRMVLEIQGEDSVNGMLSDYDEEFEVGC